MIIEQNGNDLIVKEIDCFNIKQTLDCGQAFRWKDNGDESYSGIAYGKFLHLAQHGNTVTFYNTSVDEFNTLWCKYFDLDRDYRSIINSLNKNEMLKTAAHYGSGIRILRQEPWEALCSFIISQNNNIPRIKGIVERLCENFGEKIDGGYTFPSAEKTAELSLADLSVLRSGFRAKYILDAAKKVADGELNLEKISNMPIIQAREQLQKIYGVGAKVADCTMLYGMGKLEAFPKDVWIKRAIQVLFNGCLPEAESDFAGIIQQYIFYYARETKLEI